MPYVSEAQRKKFHVLLTQGKIKKSVVDEYDKASKGKKLPEHIPGSKSPNAKKKVKFKHAQ